MSGKFWLNGRFVEGAQARLDVADRGFTLGDGLFETLAVRNGKTLRVKAHLARLGAGARALCIPVPYDDAALGRALSDTTRMNGVRDGVLRLTLSRGSGARGLAPPEKPSPTVVIAAEAGLPPETPARAIVARTARRDEGSALSRLKSLSYLEEVLARMEARDAGADEALLLNTQGRIADGAASTLFVHLGDWLLTPTIEDGALPGIVRAAAIRELGAVPRALAPEDVHRADEAVLVNSLGVRALVALDGRPIGSGKEGIWCAKLREIAHADE
ncbi:MAG: 2-keto-4-methylthiobutyrate aminotransferase [Rhodospirillales bacterium RIFCSPLOWO2_12_FULL_67_15]|nr:MAG: 2-keto-4-methylthiobutyrate aminotransferase [Rhodospirillales bacterium RIFCSPLOWO2_12_FULL_67_15]